MAYNPLAKKYFYSKRAETILRPLGIVAIVNFVVFTLVALYLGGAAMSGYAKDGHYFLSLSGHSHTLTETTKAVWLYSYYHGISLFITIFSALLIWFIFCATDDITFRDSSHN